MYIYIYACMYIYRGGQRPTPITAVTAVTGVCCNGYRGAVMLSSS